MSRNNARDHPIVAVCIGEYVAGRQCCFICMVAISNPIFATNYLESVALHSLLLSNRIKTAKIALKPIRTILPVVNFGKQTYVILRQNF
jgi:hypothetical protein